MCCQKHKQDQILQNHVASNPILEPYHLTPSWLIYSSLLMNSLKESNPVKATKVNLEWPSQLRTPTELMQALKRRTRLHFIRSPICSKIVLQIVGSWAYFLAHVMNTSKVFNVETFNQELKRIEALAYSQPQIQEHHENKSAPKVVRAPLLTMSNHISCIDDPILWASLLPLSYYSRRTDSVRWSAAAVEICFSKPWHSVFFSLGKTFPVIRGIGINQPGMEFASALLRYNQWLHLFPEGRVMRDDKQQEISNKDRGYMFKWGISKLILDYFDGQKSELDDRLIKILPFYHMGLDEILPIGWPYIPRFGKKITIYIRPKVIDMNAKLLNDILCKRTIDPLKTKSRSDDELKRIKLTNFLEEEVCKLIEPTERLHYNKAGC